MRYHRAIAFSGVRGVVMLMANLKVGRPRKSGERFPSGQLKPAKKPNNEPMSPTQWQRIVQHGKAFSSDERLWRSEVARLQAIGELTAAQTVAGLRIGALYGTYERLNGLPRRSTCSPSYEMSFRSGFAAFELLTADAMKERTLREIDASVAFKACRDKIPHECRLIVEMACVDNQPIGAPNYGILRAVLNLMIEHFSLLKRKSIAEDRQRGRSHTPLHFNAHEAAAPEAEAKVQSPRNADRHAFKLAMKKLRPDLTDDGIFAAWEIVQALKDREVHNRKAGIAAAEAPQEVRRLFTHAKVIKLPQR